MVYKVADRTVSIMESHRAPRVEQRRIGSNLLLHSKNEPNWISSLDIYPAIATTVSKGQGQCTKGRGHRIER